MKHLLPALVLAIGTAHAVTIDTIYFGQTHVLKPSDPYFGLVANREALIKAHVTDPAAVASPAVTATLTLNSQTLVLTLTGPATLPTSIPDGLGVVQHSFSNTFTGYIPAAWVKKGLQITVNAGTATTTLTNLDIGAPTKVIMTMLDVHYFSQTTGNYPTNTFEELEAKWPVAELEIRRLNNVVLPELVIPPRYISSTLSLPAVRIKSPADYVAQTGQPFDGEQAAALAWNGALKRAAGRSGRWTLQYLNIYNANAGGQAGGFAGVGNGTSQGILHHELGHALSLPHWGDNATYPYKGDMHGIQAPSNYNETHAGPAWAFDLRTKAFIPPTVQPGNVGGNPVGTYKVDPMQGGGTGYQEAGYLMNHFSDYSVNQMRDYLHGHVVVWNSALNSWASWNQTAGDYTTTVANNGVQFPTTRDTQVISIMASISGSDPDVTMVYPPIGPYTSGLIKLFDPAVAADRTSANSIYSPTTGSDLCVRVVQGGVTKTYMLAASWITNQDPLSGGSLVTEAINIPASGGAVTKIELLLTPDAEVNGLPSNPQVLSTWAPLTPDAATFELAPVAYGSSAVTMKATEGALAPGYTGTVEYLFTETSGNPGATSSGWQTSRTYTDIGLTPGTQYSYTVSIRAGSLTTATSVPASATTFNAPATLAVTVAATQQFSLQTGNGLKSVTGLGSFNASGADKLVVVISTEDANNSGTGFVHDVRYNGKVMTEAIQEDAGSAAGTAAIFYLDNPGSIGTGTIQVSAENPNGGIGAAYALSNTMPGSGASSSRTGSTANSVDLTTAGDRSVVIAVIDNAGKPNTAGTPTATTTSPSLLTAVSTGSWGSQWGGHASGYRLVTAPTAITPAFSTLTGTGYTINIAAVEFPAQPRYPNNWIQSAGGSQNWTTNANWNDGLVPNPTTGSTMDFSTVNLAANTTLNLGANRTAGLWKFGDTSGSQRWTIAAGNTLILAGTTPTIQVNNSTTQIDSIVDGTAGLTKTGAGILTLTGSNTYTGPTIVETGTLRMAGSSAATDVTVNNTAGLQIGSATGLSSANDVTLSAGTTLDLSGNSATIGTLVTAATSIITNNSTATTASTATTPGTPPLTDALTINPLIAGSIAAQITDGATRNTQVVITNSNASIQNTSNTTNTYSGGLVLANPVSGTGTRLSVGALTGTPFGTSPIIIGQTATDMAGIYFSAASTFPNDIIFNTAVGTDRVGIRLDAAVTLSGKITANLAPATFTSNSATGGNATLTGQITGASGLVLDITSKTAAATSFNVTLNNTGAPNNYLGNTVINLNAASGKSATLHLGAASQIPNGTGTGNVTINSNGTGLGTLNLAGFSETINGLGGNGIVDGTSGTPTLTLGDNDATSSFSGVIRNTAGTLTLVKIGTGTQTLTGTSTFTGSTTISAGSLTVPSNIIAASSAISIGNGATLQSTGGFTLTANQAVTGTGATGFLTTTSSTGLITTSGTTLSATGTLTLTRLSILGTGNQITGGDLQSGGAASTQRGLLVGNGNTGVLTITGGSLTSNGGSTNIDLIGNNVTTGDGTLHINGGSYINTLNTGTLSLGNNSTNGGNGTLTLTSGSATIHTLQYNTANSGAKSSAIVNLDGGTLTVSNITVTSGLTKQLNFNGGQFTAAASLPAFSGLTLNVKNGGAKINTNGFAMTLSTPMLNFGGTSTGGLTKSGAGTLTLGGANSYAGTTAVSAGTLTLGANNVLPSTPVSIGTATLNAATFSDVVDTLDVTGSAVINLGSGAVLNFANSSAIDWTGGSLRITGAFVAGASIRFGSNAAGLTSTQLALITVNGGSGPFTLNDSGFLVTNPYDSWKSQITNGLTGRTQDADGDSFTNHQEFLFGTSPIAGNGSLVTTTASGNNLVLRWLQRETGATYTLKQSATLGANSWTTVVSPIPAPDSDQTGSPADYDRHSVTVPTSGQRLFYLIEGVEN